MPRQQRMCGNTACGEYQHPTTLLGGCSECGTALVAYYVEPTTEQLARFAALVLKPDWIPGPVDIPLLTRLLDENDETRARVLSQHRAYQRIANEMA